MKCSLLRVTLGFTVMVYNSFCIRNMSVETHYPRNITFVGLKRIFSKAVTAQNVCSMLHLVVGKEKETEG
jgi:hypothetical protein